MKKHWKKILIAFLTVFLIVGGYVIYLFQFKEYDVADEEVTEITKETYKLDLPDGTSIELDEEGNIVESQVTSTNKGTSDSSTTPDENSSKETSKSDSGGTTSSSPTSGSSNDSNTNGSGSSDGNSGTTLPSNETENVTVASIKEKYTPAMASLQVQANERINALVGRAVQEYQTKKTNGESVNYAYFYNKYTSAAGELEGRTDTVFYQIVGIIEKELVANGYSKSHVNSFVNEYEGAKESRRTALIDKAINR